MDISIFMNKIEQYVNRKINFEIIDHIVKIYDDTEIYYLLDLKNMKLDICERGKRAEISKWNTEKDAKLGFALLMKNLFSSKYNKMPHDLEICKDLNELKAVIAECVDTKYYSIGHIETEKISITQDGNNYVITYKTGGREYLVDENTDKEYIFSRFYYEAVYLASLMKDLKEYETIFDESFSKAEICDLLNF